MAAARGLGKGLDTMIPNKIGGDTVKTEISNWNSRA